MRMLVDCICDNMIKFNNNNNDDDNNNNNNNSNNNNNNLAKFFTQFLIKCHSVISLFNYSGNVGKMLW